MKNCRQFRKNIPSYLAGELNEEQSRFLENHLRNCSGCREELNEHNCLLGVAGAVNEEVERSIKEINWEKMSDRISKAVFEEKRQGKKSEPWLKKLSFLSFPPLLKPVSAGLLAGLIIGSIITYLIISKPGTEERIGARIHVSPALIERVELQMAKQSTLDYLDRSQLLLLDFLQASPRETPDFQLQERTVYQARELLRQKKYINPQLEKVQMIKAKQICDQIEILFYELIAVSEDLSPENLKKIQEFIGEKQLLLKINLIKRELEQSEV
ncbi:MAG: zf-HC2 domain-containing protein [Acidobacteriota bacterium]